jgi:UDP-glucose 4-epimerase
MNVLVTGGAGFIGSHLVWRLLAHHHTVTVVDDLRHGLRTNVPEGALFRQVDILGPQLDAVMRESHFDAVIHLAAQIRVDVSTTRPDYDAEENIMGTIRVLRAAARTGVKRFIFASSAAVYGNSPEEDMPLKEEEPLHPTSFYGLSKKTAESYISLYAPLLGMSYVILRFANVYGERMEVDDEGGAIQIFAKRLAMKQPITLFGDGSQTRDWIYAGDIAEGISAALQTLHANRVYNLSSGKEVSLLDVLHEMERQAGTRVRHQFAESRRGDIFRSVLDASAARDGLGWKPMISLQEGLGRTIAHAVVQAELTEGRGQIHG